MISKEEIEYLSDLAKLKFSEEEKERLKDDFSKVLNFMEDLNKIDTENVDPLYQVYDYKQVLREDIIGESLSREEVLQNTVEKQYGYFKLLNIMD
jgi:aspartyl-tRNA(Asn)/glutamyl-tRNA(Gln) amidotransferase subunit C